jgi:hypothetical protein
VLARVEGDTFSSTPSPPPPSSFGIPTVTRATLLSGVLVMSFTPACVHSAACQSSEDTPR